MWSGATLAGVAESIERTLHPRWARGFLQKQPGFPQKAEAGGNEPLSRGRGSTPHWCEELYACGGATVYVLPKYAPNGVPEKTMAGLQKQASLRGEKIYFETRTRNATVYARGKVRHPDHKTIVLPCWHRVYMNTENLSSATRFSAFLD